MSETPNDRINKMMQDAIDNNIPAHQRPLLVMGLLKQFGIELAAMTAERDALQLLVLAFKQKRDVDGMCGRIWDSTEHLFHEREVARLLGEPEWKWKAGA